MTHQNRVFWKPRQERLRRRESMFFILDCIFYAYNENLRAFVPKPVSFNVDYPVVFRRAEVFYLRVSSFVRLAIPLFHASGLQSTCQFVHPLVALEFPSVGSNFLLQ
jgi:hypothetical protein